jgi:uncharacterized protein DUF1566
MGLLSRTKTGNPAEAKAEAAPVGKKIVLNFGGRASKAVEAIAAATLEAGGLNMASATPKIGDKMYDGTIYAGVSPDTGKPMYATPADARLAMTSGEAKKYAAKLRAHGHRDWRLPTQGELGTLFNNCAAIGGFDASGLYPAGWYWSSSLIGRWHAWAQRFSDGYQNYGNKVSHTSVRCVR